MKAGNGSHYIWIALAPARKPYQKGLLFTHKNGGFGAISVTERSCVTFRWSVNRYRSGRTHTLGARGFSCAVSGFGQVLESDPREKRYVFLAASPLLSSAFGRRNEAPRRTREKTSVTQGKEPTEREVNIHE